MHTYQTTGVTKIYKNSLVTLSNDEITTEEVAIYPNPTKYVIRIQANQNVEKVVLYTVLGEEMFQSSKNTIDMSGMSQGMYMLQIEFSNGSTITKKIIKK